MGLKASGKKAKLFEIMIGFTYRNATNGGHGVAVLPSMRQLRYLVVLADTGHFGKAAQRVGIAQPSLSLQISNLEEVLKLRLLERGRGPFRLTPEGREITERARAVVAQVQDIVDLSVTLQTGDVGTIRLGTTPTIGPYLLPYAIGELHKTHPGLKLYIRDAAPRDLVSELERGRHDVILTQLPVAGPGFVTERLFRERLALAIAPDSPLANRKDIMDADLADLVVLSLGPGYVLHEQISEVCRNAGADLRRDYEGTSLDALRQMVGMGMGVTFLPMLYIRSEVSGRDGSIEVRPFRKGKLVRSIGLVRRKSSGKNAAIDHIAEALRSAIRANFSDTVTLE
ncbi:hydrogen peroxide-inducible genes activator [Loktanella salsilacus]|uniref:hydrogen peroxide-inducible genes activator n=1 Tax=Loktanella salsilacus TaxID=195913 RepID=UPI001FE1A964|nr:hydrogen peroxide-inducible genes activator [Loktanella salsilacus]